MTDIPVDTPLGKTVADVEKAVTGIVVFGPMGDQTILALCSALREAREELRWVYAKLYSAQKDLQDAGLPIEMRGTEDGGAGDIAILRMEEMRQQIVRLTAERDSYARRYAGWVDRAREVTVQLRDARREAFEKTREAALKESLRRLDLIAPMVARIKQQSSCVGCDPCPVCTVGMIQWRMAESNGHVAMRCSTEDCVAFME